MTSTRPSVLGIVVGLLVGIALAVFLDGASTVLARTAQALPIDFKVGSRVQVLGLNGTFDIAEIQGQWIKGAYGKDETIWMYAPAAQGFVFKTPRASSK